MTAHLRFPKARMHVAPSALPRYAAWAWRTTRGADRARALAGPVPSRAPPEVERAEARARSLGASPGWTRYPTDGTRVQVFDPSARTVCHVPKGDAAPRAGGSETLGLRAELAPRLLARTTDGCQIEELVDGAPAPTSRATLEAVLDALRRTAPPPRSAASASFPAVGHLSEAESAAARDAFARLPGSAAVRVLAHGDCWPGNVWRRRDGTLCLLDWEYARETLPGADAWLYLRESGLGDPQKDEILLRELREVGCSEEQARRAALPLHVLHLLDRRAILRELAPKTTSQAREGLERDLGVALARLGGMPA